MQELVMMIPTLLGSGREQTARRQARGPGDGDAYLGVLGGVVRRGPDRKRCSPRHRSACRQRHRAICPAARGGRPASLRRMIIAAALIEGVTLFALIICLLAVLRIGG